MSVPNQKKIIIERTTEGARKDYLKVSNRSLRSAMYNLSEKAFILWIYFADNANGYTIDLYPVDFISITGLSDSTYRRAFEELEKKGYLIKSNKQKNLYLFKEESNNKDIKYIDEVWSIDKDNIKEIKEEYFSQIEE